MGVYDTMWITCPHCGKRTSEQTKDLDSCLRDIDYDKSVSHYEAAHAAGFWECEFCEKPFMVGELPKLPMVTLKARVLTADELKKLDPPDKGNNG